MDYPKGASENAAMWKSSQEHFNNVLKSGEKERADRDERNAPTEIAEEQAWMAKKNETRNIEALAEGHVDAERMQVIEEMLKTAKNSLDTARNALLQNIIDKNTVKEIIRALSSKAKNVGSEKGYTDEKPAQTEDLREQLKGLEMQIKRFDIKQEVVDSLLQKVMLIESVKEKAKRKQVLK